MLRTGVRREVWEGRGDGGGGLRQGRVKGVWVGRDDVGGG